MTGRFALGILVLLPMWGQAMGNSSWRPEDVVFQESVGELQISPDGKWLVWVKEVGDKEKDARVSQLVLSSLTGRLEIVLTRGSDSAAHPRWSPDGDRIAFLTNRAVAGKKKEEPEGEGRQIWVLSTRGGDPWPITETARGVRQQEWLDNDTIVFSAEEAPSLYESEAKRKKDDTRVVEDAAHTAPVRLFKVSLKERKIARLTGNDDWIESWGLSPDGRKAVAVHRRSLAYEWDHKTPPIVMLHDLTTGESVPVIGQGRLVPSLLRWSLDGSGFYAAAPHSTDPTFLTASITLVHFYDLTAGAWRPVHLGWENGLAQNTTLLPVPDGFLTLLADGVRNKPARYVRDGSSWSLVAIDGDHARHVQDLAASRDGKTIVYRHSTASQMDQLYKASLDGGRLVGPVVLTELNTPLKDKSFAKTEVVTWKGALEEEVEGLLYYPKDYQPGKRYPLVVAIHGGPLGADLDAWDTSWDYPINLFAERGAFVLRPNYHGSAHYGLKWAESICCGRYYDLEVPDIEKGIDQLIADGRVDGDRIGTMGWSNGSILSIQLIVTDPARFKVASTGAGDVEWISDWANVDFGQSFDAYYFGKSPLQDPQLYLRKSPLFKMERVTTPTLIFFGTEDRNVPTSQGWTHYRAMYHLNQAPVRFLLFPGEPHGLRKLSHQLRKVEEEMRWFDRYLFTASPTETESLKPGSPLAGALRAKQAARSGGRLGRSLGGVLVPETVSRDGLTVGLFEVTRAQYAQFDRGYRFPAGTDEFPATGIPFEKAKAYAAWISSRTGEQYRLPNSDEAAVLYAPRAGENTLDYWAAYSPNREDRKRLIQAANVLGGQTPLLKPVGSFAPAVEAGEAIVFDLGGNAAEWVATKDGKGEVRGGSADRASESRDLTPPTELAYVGFRLVREAPGATKKP